VILLAIYLAIEPNTYLNGFVKLFPVSKRQRTLEVLGTMGETLRQWMLGKFLAMLIIGFATTVGLEIIGVPLALTLGLIAALLTFIPNFGPIIAVTPAILFALVGSPVKALYVLGLYFGIQMVESYLITPLIERETVSLPPVLTIIFQVFMGIFVGGLGLVLASPLLAIILVLVKMVYIEDVLGDTVETPEEEFISEVDEEPSDDNDKNAG
jgi:predicted PurR-regulated permease PerM